MTLSFIRSSEYLLILKMPKIFYAIRVNLTCKLSSEFICLGIYINNDRSLIKNPQQNTFVLKLF